MIMKRSDDRGFTLIEVMVVVLIIALLIAIAIPMFLGQRRRGYEAQIKTTVRELAGHVESYAVDTNGDYSTLDSTLYADFIAKLEAEGFDWPEYIAAIGIVATATNYCIEATHTRLDAVSAWYTTVFRKLVGHPTPSDSTCFPGGSEEFDLDDDSGPGKGKGKGKGKKKK